MPPQCISDHYREFLLTYLSWPCMMNNGEESIDQPDDSPKIKSEMKVLHLQSYHSREQLKASDCMRPIVTESTIEDATSQLDRLISPNIALSSDPLEQSMPECDHETAATNPSPSCYHHHSTPCWATSGPKRPSVEWRRMKHWKNRWQEPKRKGLWVQDVLKEYLNIRTKLEKCTGICWPRKVRRRERR